jgi:3-keto-disaccharide hydrolase
MTRGRGVRGSVPHAQGEPTMRAATWAAAVVLFGTALAIGEEKVRTISFNKNDAGNVPSGWKADKTGTGEGSVWKVVADDTSPGKTGYALAQTAESPSALFNLCVAQDMKFKDGEVSVAFKAVKGQKDQGGGIVWRYQDRDNYYVARMNPLEDNYRVYKVVAGKRTQLATKEGLKVPAGEWHTLTIKTAGDRIQCFLDDKLHLEAKDSTFTDAGKVGLWSKADAQTHFDRFQVNGKE